MKKYVLGFLFSPTGLVWLIRKNKPEWQKGRLNGIGGKIEENELPLDAMIREFKEETGLDINTWKSYATLTDRNNYEIYCFYAFSNETPTTLTEEQVVSASIQYLPNGVIQNLHWLIPMALSFEKGERTTNFWIKEIHPDSIP